MKKILFVIPLMAISLLASCNKTPTYTITFKDEGDKDKIVENIKAGSIFTDVPTPSAREGYTFIGWCTDTESKNVFDFNSIKIYQDYTFYSGWKKDEPAVYTVSFNGYNCKAKGGDITDPSSTFQTTITENDDDLVLNLTANTGFALPEENDLTVLFDNEPGTPKLDYKYEKSSKKLTIIKKANTLIMVSAISNTELCYVKFDAGSGNVIEGTNERYKYYEIQKGKTWSALGNNRGIGAKQNGKDFAYWMLEGTNKYVGETYAINGNITVVPKFVDINTGDFAVHARTDNVKLRSVALLGELAKPIKYKINDGSEQTLEPNEEIDLANAGDICYFESENSSIYIDDQSSSQFFIELPNQTGLYHVSGHINSILNDAQTCSENAAIELFENNTKMISAEKIILYNNAADNCYYNMFKGCVSLIIAPSALPATVLGDSSYASMFEGCTSLIQAPYLAATTMGTWSSCVYMFYNCASLVVAPELSATTLGRECYCSMFEGCISLIHAPALPATTLSNVCYFHMFYGCSSLITAPKLPATKLESGCYNSMFYNCRSLKVSDESGVSIFDYSDSTSSSFDITNMFYGTGGTFKGTPTIGSSYYWYI